MEFQSTQKLDRLGRLLGLKRVLRQGWTRHPIPPGQVESVADHSWGVALLAWFLCPPELNRERVMELALFHDLSEVVTGDITPHDGVSEAEKANREERAELELLQGLSHGDSALELCREYREQQTAEARWVKSMDKLEMYLQSLNYEREHPVELSEFRASAAGYLRDLAFD